ncbi:hypothetical protein C7M52_02243 [Mixta theicola]|nr:hypothetical protein C7M52_02243 [Mixta theicola]
MKDLLPLCFSELFAVVLSGLSLIFFVALYVYR